MCTFAPMFGKYRIFIGLIIVASLSSCTRRALHNAQQVVTQADSLWVAGQAFDDSIALAQAYKELSQWEWIYPDKFVHCCYHYGCLLRKNEDPVAAVQVFINATHTRTKEYRILGRVYDNLGDIAHRAEEYALSYDMFEQSANMYLRNGDTLSYYYCLNDMALESAEQREKEKAYEILNKIREKNIKDSSFIGYCYNVQAQACLKCMQYDSVVYFASLSKRYYPKLHTTTLQLAQAYSYLGVKDSAVHYATRVLQETNESYDINNALYILTNDDESKDKNAIRETAADRADTQKLIEISRSKMSQAVQLLEQDLTHKPDLRWLYATIITLLIVGLSLIGYIHRKRKKQELLAQKLHALKTETSSIQEKHEELSQRYLTEQQRITSDVMEKCVLLGNEDQLKNVLAWNDFETMCHNIDQHFYLFATKLRSKHVLNETEIRLCILVLLDMNRMVISKTLPYALNSVGKLKDHTAKLLGTTGKNLRSFLLKMVIEG